MLEGILNIFTGGAAGGIIGLAGSWLTKRENRKNLEIQLKRDVLLGRLEAEADARQLKYSVIMAEKKIEQAQAEGEIATDIAETGAFTESLKTQLKPIGIPFVDGFRAMMRPVITLYLLIIATYFAINIHRLVSGLETLPQTEIVSLYTTIISQLFFLTNLAISWWFGSRGDKSDFKTK